jgi:hypothetical protein
MTERQAELQRFKKDTQYYAAHREELLDTYPEQWVAIFNEQVVGSAPDADELLERLIKKGVPIDKAYIQHLTRRDDVLILGI